MINCLNEYCIVKNNDGKNVWQRKFGEKNFDELKSICNSI